MLKVRDDCLRSFERLYAATREHLFGVVLRINRDRVEAEEILQEAYTRIWLNRRQFNPSRGLAIHWITGIAHHGAVSNLRHLGRRPQTSRSKRDDWDEQDDVYAGFPSSYPGPIDVLMHEQAARAVLARLHALPVQQRETLTLAFFDGLSHSEIARKLNKPLGTIKSWVRRSLSEMRHSLEEHS